MSKQRNPDVDFGFHATIPRTVRTGYKNLTPVQKWLYVCLKDLCGEYGTCYRTVKVLAEETGISTGMISESIPQLHEAGLIHAEKKRRSTGGKEVWHITIVDIWEANGKQHPTKRSQNEQTLENVHSVNVNVHTVNDTGRERSAGEYERSHSETEEVSLSSIITEEVSNEAGKNANPPTHTEITQFEGEVDTKLEQIKQQQEQFWSLWCRVWFNKDIPPKRTEKAQESVVKLAPHITTAEQLESLIEYTKKDLANSQGIKQKKVYLGNLVHCYSGWKQEQKPPEQAKPKQAAPMQPLPVLRVLPPDRSKSPRLRTATQVGRA